jgi:hypothetical protein
MKASEKKRGRPVGTSKNGARTPQKKLDILRTKAWSWTCSYLHGEDDKAVGINKLTALANKYSAPRKNPDKLTFYSGTFSKYRNGVQGAQPGTVIDLWPEVRDAYFKGPWVNVGPHRYYGEGMFVPLWSAIRGDIKEVLKEWDGLEIPAEPESDEWGGPLSEEFYCPSKKFKKLTEEELYGFCEEILELHLSDGRSKSKDLLPGELPPLLLFSIAITAARIAESNGSNKHDLFFDPKSPRNSGILPSMRAEIVKDLAEMNITLSEIFDVCADFGLSIRDCGAMSYEEYKKEKPCHHRRLGRMLSLLPHVGTGIIVDIEDPGGGWDETVFPGPVEITEEQWRAIFGTVSKRE